MSKDYDAREHVDRTDERRRAILHEAADAASTQLPGAERARVVSFDARTGNPAVVVTEDPEAGGDDYVRRALEHVQRLGGALGLAPGQPPEFAPDPTVQTGSAGSVAVHLQQMYKGLPVYEATETVRFDPEGRLTEVAGRSHTIDEDVPIAPTLSAQEALARAAEHVAEAEPDPPLDPFGQPLADPPMDLSGFAPEPLLVAAAPDTTMTFTAPPFEGPVQVSLLWFPLDGDLRLAWQTVLQVPGGGLYRVIVDAGDGRLLFCRQLRRAIGGRATVFLRDGGQSAETVDLPLPLERYGLPIPSDLPSGFPDDWLTGDSTDGACVRAQLADGTLARGRSSAGSIVFDPSDDPQSDEALVVNLFALNGLMHDVCYLLGFREAEGNFQRSNAGRGGAGADAVRAIVHPGAVWGTANIATPPDGRAPEMNMGLVTSTGRHTALDGDVVIHEYSHGLTNRLVGGPMNTTALDGDQSGGMGEGWGDYFACLLNGRETVGSWVVNRPGGIRLHPYTEDYPADYGDLGRAPYTGVHAVGEVWCATLLALNRRIGNGLGAQLVVDALKLSVPNPSFLAMRDALLVAARDHAASQGLGAAESADLIHRIWQAFARFGMGPGAQTNGDTLTGIVADHTVPPRPDTETPATVTASAAPELAIPDNHPAGVVSSIDLSADGTIADVSVTVDISHTYRGDLVVRLIAPGGGEALLSDRAGGRADDLKATFGAGSSPSLAALVGGPAGGRWTLSVADRARRDVGVLHGWTLEVAVGAAPRGASVSVEPGAPIPDDDPAGVTSSAPLSVDGAVRDLVLDVDVTHTYVGDLVITLESPMGRVATVHERGGGGTDNLRETYRSADDGPLAVFLGEPAAGTWTLVVADREGLDVGKLNRWTLSVQT